MTPEQVRRILAPLESGNGPAFFAHVADDVDWTVMGTHPAAAHYRSKQELLKGAFQRIQAALKDAIRLKIEHVLASGDWAAVELSLHATGRNGVAFDNRYCWMMRFSGETIVELRAYLDTALVERLLREVP